jgi:hypothetical protein
LNRLAGMFRSSSDKAAPDLIRQARFQQQAEVELVEFLDVVVGDGMMHSGSGRGADPFSGRIRINDFNARRSADAVTSGSSDPFASSIVDAGFGRGGSVVVPLPANARTGANSGQEAGTAQPIGGAPPVAQTFVGPPQIPQTFGGGGALFGVGERAPAREPFGLLPRTPAREPLAPVSTEVIAVATELHRAGKKAEAIRMLSRMAIPGQHDHALLRLLTWVLLEWGEPVIAMEVLEHTERRFGSSDTTVRDLALAELAAGRRDDALRHFRAAWHHVSRRDAAALDGRMSAALRIVLECAGDSADADLEIEGQDFELGSWRNPLPAFGGALSFDGRGMEPEDFVLPVRLAQPLKVRVRLTNSGPQPLRVTVIEEWGRPGEKRKVFLLPAAQPGMTMVTEIEAAK